ncbi:MAG: DUF1501 domain-containing protein, partial [Planctomycetes bacterium]|nr:DUF1501 domain-containing protein [Planctomycetota bacterium]
MSRLFSTSQALVGAISRRDWFSRTATGFAGLALGSLLTQDRAAASSHFAPRARAVIQLFQHGGPSHMDLLDPKPELNKRHGEKMPDSFTDLVKISAHGGLLGTPYKFHKAGKSGVEYSELLPHTATCADDIAVIRSMHTEHNNHEQALWMMHTGRIITGRPTIGAWVNYALGSENQNLPAYVVLRNDSSLPVDGTRNWSSGFLPPRYQGVHFRHTGTPVLYLQPATAVSDKTQKLRLDLLKKLNEEHQARQPAIAEDLEARIASYEMAARMQLHTAEALDITQETAATQKLYGIGQPKTESYGRRCLIARRLVERGVRFVQLFHEGQIWDTHNKNAEGTKNCCERTDQPT